MGLVLGLPIALIFSTVFKNEKGIIFGLKELCCLFKIYRMRRAKKPRFDLYDFQHKSDLFKLNLKAQPSEAKEEYKQELSPSLKTTTDNALFYGANIKGDRLVARVSRNSQGYALPWLYLKLEDGSLYSFPNERFWVEPRTGEESFVAGGLRLRCLIPMRQWRISFNGLLRKTDTGGVESVVHIKFGFIWNASSPLHDLKDELTESELAKFLSSQSKSLDVDSVTKYLDCYVQEGNMIGSLQVEGQDEMEIYLWGARKRSKDVSDLNSPVDQKDHFVYSKDGHFLHHGQVKFPLLKGKLEYGFVIFSNGLGGAVNSLKSNIKKDNSDEIVVYKDEFNMKFTIYPNEFPSTMRNGDSSNGHTNLSFCKAKSEVDDEAICLTLHYNNRDVLNNPKSLPVPQVHIPFYASNLSRNQLVTSLCEANCRLAELTGGKGSSLADLSKISEVVSKNMKFEVPKGIVVTTAAYQKFFVQSGLQPVVSALEKVAWSGSLEELKHKCKNTVQAIEGKAVSHDIETEIIDSLQSIFGQQLDTVKLAIRSSASGEDSEELSAAGQMTTYLGMQGKSEILKSVVKCWASQFSFVAIQYKKQNGQKLNAPMAVVLQEMVPGDTAGVMFTCDPVTGNPAKVTITANYGIGESVVSAAADPDTVVHFRDENGLTGEVKIEVGKKSTQIVMTGSGGVEEKETDSELSNQCCLPSSEALKLAQIGVTMEDAYGCPVDIEWAVKHGQIYLLQCRPITTFDKESDFEIRHEFDSPMRTEREISSTANVGEVMPGAFSPLGGSSMFKVFELAMQWSFGCRSKTTFPNSPYYNRALCQTQGHNHFAILDSVLRFYRGEETFITNAQMVALLGRLLDDQEAYNMAAKRNKYWPMNNSLEQLFYLLKDMWCTNDELKQAKKNFWNERVNLAQCKTSEEAYEQFWSQFLRFTERMCLHPMASVVSMLYNLFLLHLLVKENKGWSDEVYSDLAYVLSSCSDVESAEVPYAMESLSAAIAKSKDSKTFKAMSTAEAHEWLLKSNTEASKQFQDFLKNHGHRCYREFDIMIKPWGVNPLPLIKTLQEMSGSVTVSKKKGKISTSETMANMKTKLGFKNRLLAHLAIPLCRKAVGMRERSKSLGIKIVDISRDAWGQLYDVMSREGRISDPDLFYYFTIYELELLIKTRSPKLIQKAIRRKQLHKSMDSLIYPDIMKGIPKPVNYQTDRILTQGTLTMKGTPVSTGIATGPARVATSLEEAAEIKPGEVLIAYSTDIGWSPYFPMLAGVATELGGLVSHGAVVAREYGLPCVVGVHGATLQFQTGDTVVVNGTKGTLERLA